MAKAKTERYGGRDGFEAFLSATVEKKMSAERTKRGDGAADSSEGEPTRRVYR